MSFTTVHEQIRANIATAMAVASVVTISGRTHTKPTGVVVSRDYLRPKKGSIDLVVKAAEDANGRMPLQIGYEDGAMGCLACRQMVDIVARTTGGVAETSTDELLLWAHVAVMKDRTLSGLAANVEPMGAAWSSERGEPNEAGARLRVEVLYYIAMDDPSLSKA